MLIHSLHKFVRSCVAAEKVKVSPCALWTPCVHRRQWHLKWSGKL